jgi:hypothetical protein
VDLSRTRVHLDLGTTTLAPVLPGTLNSFQSSKMAAAGTAVIGWQPSTPRGSEKARRQLQEMKLL